MIPPFLLAGTTEELIASSRLASSLIVSALLVDVTYGA